jgi:hypothetical protein
MKRPEISRSSIEFLNQNFGMETIQAEPHETVTEMNAANAEKNLGIPRSLWLSLSKEIRSRVPAIRRELCRQKVRSEEVLIVVGFALGWIEAEKLPPGRIVVIDDSEMQGNWLARWARAAWRWVQGEVKP